MVTYFFEYLGGYYRWVRLGDWHSDKNITMFGDRTNWLDINNYGYAVDSNSYILASMTSIAEFPTLVESVFLTKKLNKEGIYAVRFFIRGKPWIVTVDDEVLLTSNQNNFLGIRSWQHRYAQLGDDNSAWGAILEKAWAKVKGSYRTSYDGGFMTNGIRALVGSPVFTFPLNPWKDLMITEDLSW